MFMWRSSAVLMLFAVMALGCQRPIQIDPGAVADAQLGVRVKTVLVNDPQLGPRVIEVRVTRGVVTLVGLVGSRDEAAHAVDLVRQIPGVAEVRSQLSVREPSEIAAPPGDESLPVRQRASAEEVSAARRRLLALGVSLNRREPANAQLGSSMSAGPLLRLGSGRGLGVTLGFSWFNADLASGSSPGTLGRITIRPVMGGASYTFTDDSRWALAVSLVGGMAFNSFEIDETRRGDVLALAIDHSAAIRPGVSLWLDVNSRAAFNIFSGYVITRPEITFLEAGQFTKRAVRADAAVFSVGLAYKLF